MRHILKNRLGDFVDYPLLIRLNPNIPWKTRGNAAVCLRLRTHDRKKIVDHVARYVEDESATDAGANPGVIISLVESSRMWYKNLGEGQCMIFLVWKRLKRLQENTTA